MIYSQCSSLLITSCGYLEHKVILDKPWVVRIPQESVGGDPISDMGPVLQSELSRQNQWTSPHNYTAPRDENIKSKLA